MVKDPHLKSWILRYYEGGNDPEDMLEMVLDEIRNPTRAPGSVVPLAVAIITNIKETVAEDIAYKIMVDHFMDDHTVLKMRLAYMEDSPELDLENP